MLFRSHRDPVTVPIERGENTGKSITYYNVVRKLRPIAMWKGKEVTIDLPSSNAEYKVPETNVLILSITRSGELYVQDDPRSPLNYYRRAIRLRKANAVLVYGAFRDLNPLNPHVFAYTRTLGADRVLVVLTFSREPRTWSLPDGIAPGELLLANHPDVPAAVGGTLALRPYEARVYRVT